MQKRVAPSVRSGVKTKETTHTPERKTQPKKKPIKKVEKKEANHDNSDLLSKISSIDNLAKAMQEIV